MSGEETAHERKPSTDHCAFGQETGLPRPGIRNTLCRLSQAMPKTHKSLKGQLLLDNGRLQGSFFHRSVILICQHDSEGAFGLVINHTTENMVGEAVAAQLPTALKQMPLFLGGPVQPQALSFLHHDTFLPEASVMPNLNLDHSLDSLMELGDSYSPSRQIRVFAGYAGWSAGQLDDEMKRDTWLTHPASIDLVFYPKPSDLWKLILAEKGWKYRLMGNAPDDLSWN
jgi:putative transcriptional regulator